VGVPLILRGPGVPKTRISAPASLVDLFPTILDAAGVARRSEDLSLPGRSLLATARGAAESRPPAFAEYHAIGAITGIFMLRDEQHKYVHYEGYEPQIFDMAEDPGETRDIAALVSPSQRRRLRDALFEICRPDLVNRQAFSDQAARIAELGGADAIMNAASFHFTPVPSAEGPSP
jgi:choline-sulfatase